MNKFIRFIKNILNFIPGLFKRLPKIWLFQYSGSAEPLPPSPPKEEPLFEKEEDVTNTHTPRDRIKGGYRHYNELGVDLFEAIMSNNFPVGSSVHLACEEYVAYHCALNPNANPKTYYYNGPAKRELRNIPHFVTKGIKFKEQVVYSDKKTESFGVGDKLFKITREN